VGPTAKSVILELLGARAGEPLSARAAVAACELFDISQNSVRVALVRLGSSGLIEAAGRGEYRLASGAQQLAREVMSWRSAEEQVKRWSGDYVAVFSGSLGRCDRVALRRRARALSILGFAESERGLFLRPDNLRGGVAGVRTRLLALGLEPQARVFGASALGADHEACVRRLWDGKALSTAYRRSRSELERWLDGASGLEPDVAAREAFLLGGRAIRQIVYDPLLPPPFVDIEARRAFIESMKVMDREGRRLWERFFARLDLPAASVVHEQRLN
jgi:phenylacetic acid degradation operon negative regulatory protein